LYLVKRPAIFFGLTVPSPQMGHRYGLNVLMDSPSPLES
jgi:hypothetical protein